MSTPTIHTTTTSARAWAPDVAEFAPTDVIASALVLQTSTVLGQVDGDAQLVRVAWVADAEAGFVPEGAEITEADPALNEIIITTGKVAQLAALSREQYNQAGTAENLAESVARAVTRKANQAYLAQPAPTAPATTPPTGLLHTTGILAGFDPITDNLDALADAVAAIETNGGQPTHIIAAPDAWGALRKLKLGTDYNATLLGSGTADQDKRLLGIPVTTTPAVPSGRLLVLDQTAVVSAVGPLTIATSEHALFRNDGVLIRATWRFGQNVVHPDRLATLTVTETDENSSSSS